MATSAKGIPDRGITGDITKVPLYTPLSFVRQEHRAKRAGKHEDFRIGNEGGMYSWALRKGLPQKAGEKHLAITQPLHTYAYRNFEGTIGKGYGSGTVRKIEGGELILLEATPNKIKFTRSDKRNSPLYVMIKTGQGNWLVIKKEENAPPFISQYKKEHFKGIPISKVADEIDKGAMATPKLDGAGAIAAIAKNNIDVYGIRRDKDNNLIRYTDYIDGTRNVKIPPELVGKGFRAEVIAERDGKVLSPQELSGILNSTLSNAIRKKRQEKIKLRLAALATLDNTKEDYADEDTLKAIASSLSPVVFIPPRYNTGGDAMAALSEMQKGEHPLTQEGLVLLKGGRPYKAKLTEDSDVIIKNIFPADTKGEPRAGGFEYSLPGSDEVTGRVGTGFTHHTLQDMLKNPETYLGRKAKIKSRGQYESGAHRAPSFISLHDE